jgi:hypothetical protein
MLANLRLDGRFDILKGLQGGFAGQRIGHLLGSLADFLVEDSFLLSHRQLPGTELYRNAREL